MLQVGAILGGRLRVDRLLGAGGMGIVVAATHLELHQEVAVKLLRDELADNPTTVERFLREARAVARLRTEHVCRVFDVGRLETGAPYIVMELLAGADLGTAIARGPLPVATAVEYIVQACVAVGEAHAAGIIHRDLKPANLFVTRRPDGGPLIKVLDFGIAKATQDGRLTATASMLGSPGYMSPEQLMSARDVDPRTDIWALGVTLYQLVSKRMPFPGDKLAEIAIRIQTAPPDPLDVDPALAAVVMRCLDKDPARRYPDVAALVAALLPFGGVSAQRFAGAVPAAATLAGGPATAVERDAQTIGSEFALPITAPAGQTRARSQGTAAPTRAPSHGASEPAGSPHAPAQPAPAARRGRGVLLAIAGMVLVGGGLTGGWLMRGHPAAAPTSPRDAGTAIADAARVASPPPDAPVARAPDAAVQLAVTPADAAPPPPDAPPPGRDAGTGARDGGTDSHQNHDAFPNAAKLREDLERSLTQGEAYLPKITDPATHENMAVGLVMMACQLGHRDKAQLLFKQVLSADHREQTRKVCDYNKVPLAK